ncbi:MAG: copper resistance protein B [Gemmatimonadota bacterium]|nr:copper resistance protein B [Gemmatimonadota bacterium]
MCADATRRAMRGVIATALTIMASAMCADTARAQMAGMSSTKMMTWEPTLFILADQLEASPGEDGRPVGFDVMSWYGSSHQRLWVRAQGDIATTRHEGEAEAQVLYGRLVDPFWDAVIGVRADRGWGRTNPNREYLAVGLIGLAPYRFELSPTLFVSTKGKISARLEAAYALAITQRLMLEPEVELNASMQDVPAYGVTRGLNDYETGVRMRYEFRREFAPYVGLTRSRRSGDGAEAEAGSAKAAARNQFVLGLRLWR